jgi:hypothetical protein
MACHVSCDECTGPAETQCTKCSSDRTWAPATTTNTFVGDVTGTCVCILPSTDPGAAPNTCYSAPCPDGFYKDFSDPLRPAGECKVCNSACITCKNEFDHGCTACNVPFYEHLPGINSDGSKTCKCATDY